LFESGKWSTGGRLQPFLNHLRENQPQQAHCTCAKENDEHFSPVKILRPVLDLLQRRHRRLDFLRLGNEGVCGCTSGQTKGFAVVKADKEVVCHTCSERYKRLLSAVILCNSFLWPSACTQ
jgi:hypothetical protein